MDCTDYFVFNVSSSTRALCLYCIPLCTFLHVSKCIQLLWADRSCIHSYNRANTCCLCVSGPAAHQAMVQYSVGWLSLGGQLPPLQPDPQREGGTPLLPGNGTLATTWSCWIQALWVPNTSLLLLFIRRSNSYCVISVVAGHVEVLHWFWDQWPDWKRPDGQRDDHFALRQNPLLTGELHTYRGTRNNTTS